MDGNFNLAVTVLGSILQKFSSPVEDKDRCALASFLCARAACLSLPSSAAIDAQLQDANAFELNGFSHISFVLPMLLARYWADGSESSFAFLMILLRSNIRVILGLCVEVLGHFKKNAGRLVDDPAVLVSAWRSAVDMIPSIVTQITQEPNKFREHYDQIF